MFRQVNYKTANKIKGVQLYEDKCLTEKLKKLKTEGGQIETGAPMEYTNRTDGVLPQHDIRTDKWEIAQNKIQGALDAKRAAKAKEKANEIAMAQEAIKNEAESPKTAENGQTNIGTENPTAGN